MIRGSGSSGVGQAIKRLSMDRCVFSWEKEEWIYRSLWQLWIFKTSYPVLSQIQVRSWTFKLWRGQSQIPMPHYHHCQTPVKDRLTESSYTIWFFFSCGKGMEAELKGSGRVKLILSLLVCCVPPPPHCWESNSGLYMLRQVLYYWVTSPTLLVLEKARFRNGQDYSWRTFIKDSILASLDLCLRSAASLRPLGHAKGFGLWWN